MRNIIQHNVPSPRSIDPTFPASLEEILMGMLQADPTQRFQSAGAVERALRAFVNTAGEPDASLRLGELARTLDPARYQAKTDLVVRELLTPQRRATPMPAQPPRDDGADLAASRTVVSSRPPRVATQAAPQARSAPPQPQPVDASEMLTVPLSDHARAAIASINPPAPAHPPLGEGPADRTQPTMRRNDLSPVAPRDIDHTTPSLVPPRSDEHGDRTMMAGDPYGRARTPSMRPPAVGVDPSGIQQQ